MKTVYHGATCIVRNPLCHIGRDNLDFGKGFYITEEASRKLGYKNRKHWAATMA